MRRFMTVTLILALFAGFASFRFCQPTAHVSHQADTDVAVHHQHVGPAHTTADHHAAGTDPTHDHDGACLQLMRCHWAALPEPAMRLAGELDVRAPAQAIMNSSARPTDPSGNTPPPRLPA